MVYKYRGLASCRTAASRHKRPYSEPVVLLLPDPPRRAAMGPRAVKGLWNGIAGAMPFLTSSRLP